MSLKGDLEAVYFSSQTEYFEATQEEIKKVLFTVAAQGVNQFSYRLGPIPQARLTLLENWLKSEGIEVPFLTKEDDGSVIIAFRMFDEKTNSGTFYRGFGRD